MLTQCSTESPCSCPCSLLKAMNLFKSISRSEKAESVLEMRRVESVSRKASRLAHPVRASIRSTYLCVVIPLPVVLGLKQSYRTIFIIHSIFFTTGCKTNLHEKGVVIPLFFQRFHNNPGQAH